MPTLVITTRIDYEEIQSASDRCALGDLKYQAAQRHDRALDEGVSAALNYFARERGVRQKSLEERLLAAEREHLERLAWPPTWAFR